MRIPRLSCSKEALGCQRLLGEIDPKTGFWSLTEAPRPLSWRGDSVRNTPQIQAPCRRSADRALWEFLSGNLTFRRLRPPRPTGDRRRLGGVPWMILCKVRLFCLVCRCAWLPPEIRRSFQAPGGGMALLWAASEAGRIARLGRTEADVRRVSSRFGRRQLAVLKARKTHVNAVACGNNEIAWS